MKTNKSIKIFSLALTVLFLSSCGRVNYSGSTFNVTDNYQPHKTTGASQNTLDAYDQGIKSGSVQSILNGKKPVNKSPKNVTVTNYQEVLDKWDTDKKDEGLTYKEILSEADSDNDKIVTLEELKDQGLSEEDALLVTDKLSSKEYRDDELVYQLVELDKRVFPGGITKISASDIRQGERSVCYFLAAIAGIAHHKRTDDILNLIKKKRDGTFDVKFPGVKLDESPFNVEYPSDKELEEFIFRGKNGSSWVSIIVHGYNQYTSKSRKLRSLFTKTFSSNYGLTWEGIESQTGFKAKKKLVNLYKSETMLHDIKRSLNSKKVIVAGTFLKGNNISLPFFKKKNQKKFGLSHVLTITGVDVGNETITMRDPYGEFSYYDSEGEVKVNEDTDGVMTLTVKEVKKYFLDISYETDEQGTFKLL